MENKIRENGNDGEGVEVGSKNKFPLSFWEVTVASSVVLGFLLGLLGVYLTMPESDYSFLKLPRNLDDLQILRYFFLIIFFLFPRMFFFFLLRWRHYFFICFFFLSFICFFWYNIHESLHLEFRGAELGLPD